MSLQKVDGKIAGNTTGKITIPFNQLLSNFTSDATCLFNSPKCSSA